MSTTTNGRWSAPDVPVSVAVIESSIPASMTIAEYRRTRVTNRRPWWRRFV